MTCAPAPRPLNTPLPITRRKPMSAPRPSLSLSGPLHAPASCRQRLVTGTWGGDRKTPDRRAWSRACFQASSSLRQPSFYLGLGCAGSLVVSADPGLDQGGFRSRAHAVVDQRTADEWSGAGFLDRIILKSPFGSVAPWRKERPCRAGARSEVTRIDKPKIGSGSPSWTHIEPSVWFPDLRRIRVSRP